MLQVFCPFHVSTKHFLINNSSASFLSIGAEISAPPMNVYFPSVGQSTIPRTFAHNQYKESIKSTLFAWDLWSDWLATFMHRLWFSWFTSIQVRLLTICHLDLCWPSNKPFIAGHEFWDNNIMQSIRSPDNFSDQLGCRIIRNFPHRYCPVLSIYYSDAHNSPFRRLSKRDTKPPPTERYFDYRWDY